MIPEDQKNMTTQWWSRLTLNGNDQLRHTLRDVGSDDVTRSSRVGTWRLLVEEMLQKETTKQLYTYRHVQQFPIGDPKGQKFGRL